MAGFIDKHDHEAILGILQIGGHPCRFDDPYDEIQEGSKIVIWTDNLALDDPESDYPADAYRLRLTAVRVSEMAMERAVVSPASKIFEAEVVRTTADRKFLEELEEEDRVLLGSLFPDGTAWMIDHAADC